MFAILIASTTFSSNSLEKINDKLLIVKTELENSDASIDDYACKISCYATATNRETGEVKYFEAESTSSDCAAATVDCFHKAMGKAMNFIKAYDGQ